MFRKFTSLMLIAGFVLLVVACSDKTEVKKTDLKTFDDSVAYIIGTSLGKNLKKDSIKLNLETLKWGIHDGMTLDSVLINEEQAGKVMMKLQTVLTERQKAKAVADGAKNLKDGKAFLEANKNKPGVKTTASGLQYIVIKEGTGKSPKITDSVTVHYTGMTIDGKKFDSSVDRGQPITFPLDKIIKGWTEGVLLMKEGGKCKLFIPSELAYGENAPPAIGPNAVLIFEVELIKVASAK